MAPQSADNVDDVLSEILDYQVDGIVLASVAMSSDLVARCDAAGVPVVLFIPHAGRPALLRRHHGTTGTGAGSSPGS